MSTPNQFINDEWFLDGDSGDAIITSFDRNITFEVKNCSPEDELYERGLARRIVACLNACRGFDSPNMEVEMCKDESDKIREALRFALFGEQ